MSPRPNWESVPCEHCGAALGESCVNPNGSRYTYIHKQRSAAYTAANPDPERECDQCGADIVGNDPHARGCRRQQADEWARALDHLHAARAALIVGNSGESSGWTMTLGDMIQRLTGVVERIQAKTTSERGEAHIRDVVGILVVVSMLGYIAWSLMG